MKRLRSKPDIRFKGFHLQELGFDDLTARIRDSTDFHFTYGEPTRTGRKVATPSAKKSRTYWSNVDGDPKFFISNYFNVSPSDRTLDDEVVVGKLFTLLGMPSCMSLRGRSEHWTYICRYDSVAVEDPFTLEEVSVRLSANQRYKS